MNGFAALTDFEGDHNEIVKQRQKAKADKEQEKQAKATAAKVKFEELKAKAGRGAWGDSDDEDDMFASPPVRSAQLSVLSAYPLCQPVSSAARRPTSAVAASADGTHEAASRPGASRPSARRTAA